MISDKVRENLEALKNAMIILDKSLDLGQQTGRFRNLVSRNDMDALVATVSVASKLLAAELKDSMEE